VKLDPVLKNKPVWVEAWTLWFPHCGLITKKGKQTIQRMSSGKSDRKKYRRAEQINMTGTGSANEGF